MFRNLLSNRLIQAGLAFFVIVVGGSLLYSWHAQRTTENEFGKRPQAVSLIENKQATSTAPVDFQTEGVVNTPEENTDIETMVEETEALENQTFDLADTFLPDDMGSEEKIPADFPETPEGFPMTPLWDDDTFPNYQKGDMPGHEMIYRVLIKLWNQGDHNFINGIRDTSNGRVYPLYPDTIYVKSWKKHVVRSPPDKPRTIRVPRGIVGTHIRFFTPEELYFHGVEASYPEIKFVEKHTAGYDPETFLTDDEK